MSHCDRESHSSPNGIELERILQQLESPITKCEELQRSGDLDWLSGFGRSNRLLMAAVAPQTFTLHYANETFCQFLGISPNRDPSVPIDLFELLPASYTTALLQEAIELMGETAIENLVEIALRIYYTTRRFWSCYAALPDNVHIIRKRKSCIYSSTFLGDS